MENLARIIHKIRVKQGMTQVEACKAMNISVMSFLRMRNGLYNPRPLTEERMKQFIKKYGQSVDMEE